MADTENEPQVDPAAGPDAEEKPATAPADSNDEPAVSVEGSGADLTADAAVDIDEEPEPDLDLSDLDAELSAQKAKKRRLRINVSSGGLLTGLSTLFLSPFSKDADTRKMGRTFYFGVLIGVLTLMWANGSFTKRVVEEVKKEEGLVALDIDYPAVYVGAFFIPFRRAPVAAKFNEPLDMAKADIVVACDSTTTCDYLEKYIDYVKDQIIKAIGSHQLDREELLSFEGKQKIKEEILKRLNNWLKHGEVKEVTFTRLSMG